MNKQLQATQGPAPWKILIVDDDADVHTATRMALRGIDFRGRTLEFLDAYSGTQALELLQDHPDCAVIFMDVIMETDDAGLRTAVRLREMGFKLPRIIVRTGFQGQAPERKVIVDYDIHDYKEKAGLSAQSLFTTVISALRAYDDLLTLEAHKRGLMGVLESVSWFDVNAIGRYVSGMLVQFATLLRLGSTPIVIAAQARGRAESPPWVLACLRDGQVSSEYTRVQDLPPGVAQLIVQSLELQSAISTAQAQTLFFHNHGIDLVVHAEGPQVFAQADDVLLDVFLMTVCQAISNHRNFRQVVQDRDALLRSLALQGMPSDANTAQELDRVAALTTAMAQRLHTSLSFGQEIGMDFIGDIGVASLLHHLDESALSGAATAVGVNAAGALGLVRDILSGRHAHVDGSGHPQGLRGDAIPLAARLVAVAAAYVAMTSPGAGRQTVAPLVAQQAIESAQGQKFDPRIVHAFLEVVADGLGP